MAMIIPGVSGGTVAVLLGIYDKLIESVGNLFKDFKKSFLFLLPVLLGAVIAVGALIYPIGKALEYVPFPTIMLFAGLLLGSIPDLIFTARRNGFKQVDVISVIISFALVVGLCFIPNVGNADLSAGMPVGGYFLLILIGAVASCALVVPGVSGSMLLLIFGYYDQIIATFSALTTDFGHSLLVLALFALGLVVGFITIAKLMQFLLNRYRRATFWAIVGFVMGSVPAVIITFFKDYGAQAEVYLTPLQSSLGVILFVAGGIATLLLTRLAQRKAKQRQEQCSEPETERTQPERTDG